MWIKIGTELINFNNVVKIKEDEQIEGGYILFLNYTPSGNNSLESIIIVNPYDDNYDIVRYMYKHSFISYDDRMDYMLDELEYEKSVKEGTDASKVD